ncbi:hypothetical protein D4L85_00380 [Chryseolinea soli]|uniref:Uncharacterized protein n=2 Tax=Chryseolinea soli TaxID=2321403 RepID=A0A385SIE2_9BACT|nr:hypothetical protein D4L85_00380 [Chryseolinea soli]
MMRRAVILVILCSMMLHCASRVGFLSYLYSQRHEIAYRLGLIAEIPIALCSSDYDFNDGLTVHSNDEDGASQRTLPIALEIKLFFVSHSIQVPHLNEIRIDRAHAPRWSKPLNGCLRSVFHPPAHLS